jgi:hypothetical protein
LKALERKAGRELHKKETDGYAQDKKETERERKERK